MSRESKETKNEQLRAALGVRELKEKEKPKRSFVEILKHKFAKLDAKPSKSLEELSLLVYDSNRDLPQVFLNGQAKDSKGENITCRHLADFVASKHMKDYSHLLSTVGGIQEQLKENKYDSEKTVYKSAYYQLFQIGNLGETLHSIAQVLEKGEGCTLMLHSETHGMSIDVLHKNDGTYVIKFFDPNITNRHCRALCKNLDTVKTLKIGNFLTDKYLDPYFKKFKNAVLFSRVKADLAPPMFIIDDAVAVDTVPGFLHTPFEQGCVEWIKAYVEAILKGDFGRREKRELLASKFNGYPGLYAAFSKGNAEVVEAYTKAILKSDLDNADKIELLAARGADGAPGLYRAFGHAETVKVYAEAILRSNLGIREKVELLAGKFKGCPGLYGAFARGDAEAIKAYTKAILESDLDNVYKKELLMGKNENGWPGLRVAISRGHANAVKAYIDAISESSLSITQKMSFLDFEISSLFGSRSLSSMLPTFSFLDNAAEKVYRAEFLRLDKIIEDRQKAAEIGFSPSSNFFARPQEKPPVPDSKSNSALSQADSLPTAPLEILVH